VYNVCRRGSIFDVLSEVQIEGNYNHQTQTLQQQMAGLHNQFESNVYSFDISIVAEIVNHDKLARKTKASTFESV